MLCRQETQLCKGSESHNSTATSTGLGSMVTMRQEHAKMALCNEGTQASKQASKASLACPVTASDAAEDS